MQLPLLEKPESLLETAFRKARKQAGKISIKNNRKAMLKKKEIICVQVAGNCLEEKLWQSVKNFPSISAMQPLFAELCEAVIDANKTKKAIAQINEGARIIEKIRKESILKIKKIPKANFLEMKKTKKSFLGRASSIVKSLEKSILIYNDSARKLRELPRIDFEAKTVILAGYPNTGKTTILQRLTGAKAKIASYPFTTTQLNLGYFEQHFQRIQVIDTPGLLDKPEEKRNPVEKKAIAALKHLANLIVFVADASMHCGYPLEKQKKLFEEIKDRFKGKKILLVFNKGDITGIMEIEKAAGEFGEKAIIEGEGRESKLKEEVVRALLSKTSGF